MKEDRSAGSKSIAENFELPSYNDIPDVGLFLKQVVRYIEKYSESAGLQPLTASMISNYVKKKIIANPVKKMYDRDQIAYLIFITFAKNAIQIEDMQTIFDMQKKKFGVRESYEYFSRQMKACILEVFGLPYDNCNSDDKKTLDTSPLFSEKALLKNICITVAHKIYLEHCIRLCSGE
ncbi:MAG: DUF1836 domain-containing protein [Lachnospiraceae bacterium]|nr:DUF1836 domain-containing protein [Lachnospiraceae bacterium]